MKVATDIGGTFTDLVAIDENGSLILEKAHTTPPNFDQGVMDVLKKSGVDMKSIEAFFHGTTTIINALTERKGAKTALITTKGFLAADRRCFLGRIAGSGIDCVFYLCCLIRHSDDIQFV